MDESKRKIMYIAIIAICVISIAVGLISEVGVLSGGRGKVAPSANNTGDGDTQFNPGPEEFFDEMFKNTTTKDDINFKEDNYKKMNASEPLVWEFFNKDVSDNAQYTVKVKLPCFNLSSKQENGQNVKELNKSIQETFGNPINEILDGRYSENVIYNGDYAAFINGEKLSLVVRGKIKVGNNTQDMIIKTYNLDLKTLNQLNLEEELSNRGYSVTDAEKVIREAIEAKIKYAEDLKSSNLTPYERKADNKMYKIENTTEFFITDKGDLYVVYSYGNDVNTDTTEKDVIKFEAKK